MRFAFLLLLPLAGCATSQTERFVLPQGEPMDCRHYEQEPCGMTLTGCGSEHSVEFECMSGIQYVGPDMDIKLAAPVPKKEHPPGSPTVPADYAPKALEDLQ